MMWKSTNGSRGSTGKTFITGSVISTTTNWALSPNTFVTEQNIIPSPFRGFSFILSFLRKLKPPLVPKLKYEGDTSNFDDYPEDDLNKVPGVSEREQRIFDDFWSLHRKTMGVKDWRRLCGQKFFLWKRVDLPGKNRNKDGGYWAACINVISCCPNSQLLIQQKYFCRYSECIFTRYANIFLNVLRIYFCKIFLCMICAPQLKNLKSNTKLWINNPAVHLFTTLIIGN